MVVGKNLDQQVTIFFIIKDARETILNFHKEPWEYCNFLLL